MFFKTDFVKLYEELNNIQDKTEANLFFTSLLDELSKFDYAFIDADGKELDEEEAMKAVVQSPDQLEDLKKGVCTDFVEYTRAKLNARKIPYEVYYIICVDKDEDRPSHVFVVIENEGKFLWLEAAWHAEAGIHEYDSLEELFEDIARKHCIYDDENYLESCEIREIKKSLVGMSQEAIYDYVDTLPIAWKAAEEGITEEFDPPYNEQQVRDNYGEETYHRLIKDPAHHWRMQTGIELIHKEPSKKELERIWVNWQLMTDKQKQISDKKSIQLFGKTNAENYSELIKLYESAKRK